MASLRRRLSSVLSTLFPEKRLFIQTGDSTRYLRLTPLSQLASGTALLLAAGWMAIATATVAIDLIGPMRGETQAVVIQGAYQARLEQLAEERDRRTGEARSAQTRFQVAMKQISRQQTAILQSVEQRRELSTALDLMRQRLHDAVGQRDAVARANDRLLDQMNEVSASLNRRNSSGTDLSETLQTVSGALAEAAAARDVANTERTALTQQVAELETRMRLNTQRQDEMVDQLEQAVAMSFGPLEKMFKTTNLDVDSLIATVRTAYSGEGGPLGAVTVSTRSFDDPGHQLAFRSPDARPRSHEPVADRREQGPVRRAVAVRLPLHQPLRLPPRPQGPGQADARRGGSGRAARYPDLRHRRRRGGRGGAGKRLRQRRSRPARVRFRNGLCPPEQNPGESGTTGIARRANR